MTDGKYNLMQESDWNWIIAEVNENLYQLSEMAKQRVDFPKSAVRGSWKRRTFVTRKRAKFTSAFLLRWRQWMLIIILY
jgi:hypothetical protein